MAKVLFLDIKMPRRNGFEVLEWARSRPELNFLRIIMLSGSGLPADVERASLLGANRYLVKYPHGEELAAAVEGDSTCRRAASE